MEKNLEQVQRVFAEMEGYLSSQPAEVSQLEGSIGICLNDISGDERRWVLSFAPTLQIKPSRREAIAVLECSSSDLYGIWRGTLNPQKLFLSGVISAKGDLEALLYLTNLLLKISG